jgi:hypothetical protein
MIIISTKNNQKLSKTIIMLSKSQNRIKLHFFSVWFSSDPPHFDFPFPAVISATLTWYNVHKAHKTRLSHKNVSAISDLHSAIPHFAFPFPAVLSATLTWYNIHEAHKTRLSYKAVSAIRNPDVLPTIFDKAFVNSKHCLSILCFFMNKIWEKKEKWWNWEISDWTRNFLDSLAF